MTLPVGDIGDQALGFPQGLADDLDDIDVAHLVMAANVVDLAHPALMDNQVNGFAVILHIQPVPDVFSLSIDRQRLVV